MLNTYIFYIEHFEDKLGQVSFELAHVVARSEVM